MELSLTTLDQLFNSLDPSPFVSRDLDHDAEEFILGWAQEIPHGKSLHLLIHLERGATGDAETRAVQQAIQNYFRYRMQINRIARQELFRQGRIDLCIGVGFLVTCLTLSRNVAARFDGSFGSILTESLTIAGWVAMWQPMHTYLYAWWPVWRRGVLYRRLSETIVELQSGRENPTSTT